MSQPNFLLIYVDDLGYTDLGYMGSKFYETPNIDQLAKDGMIFTRGYAPAANCAPSRASLLTGKVTPRHGILTVGNSDRGESVHRKLIPIENKTILAKEHKTIANHLKNNGYKTIHVGKWHISEDPKDFGFDINIAGGKNGMPKSYFAPYQNVNLIPKKEGEYLPERIASEACLALEENRKDPFFMYLSTYLVHTPIQGKEDKVEYFTKKLKGLNPDQAQNHFNPVYASMVSALDDTVGKVLEKLKQLNLEKSTMVIFTSDNGGVRAISRQNPLRAGKGSYYEGGIREPFIIKKPNLITPGSVCNESVSQLDILPTIMDLCNGEIKDTYDGISLMPLLKGEIFDYDSDRNLFWHFPVYLEAYDPLLDEGNDPIFRTRPGSAMIQGKWKLIHYYENNQTQLFDLDKDLSETEDLSSKHKDITTNLTAKLNRWLDSVRAEIPTKQNPEYNKNVDLALREKLLREIKNKTQAPIATNDYYRVMKFID